jgi:hypothetical protein
VVCALLFCAAVNAQDSTSATDSKQPMASIESEFSVEQPGSITFKTGVVIVGNVEKPQVMIFLPKEKSYYRQVRLSRSFEKDAAEPMLFEPVVE